MSKPVILTGLRANNNLHIGNYLGALLPLTEMATQRAGEYQINLFMPDLHSFTTPIDHSSFHDDIMQNLRIFVAAGLPIAHQNVYLYRQSYVPAHSELAWILNCFTGYGEFTRMAEFKDKSTRLGEEHIGVGQFTYPALMAADILLYGASYIPVGDDQRQHIEYARNISERLNNRFGELFVIPKPMQEQHTFFGKDQGLRIKDLQDPSKKMSKSDETGKGVIFMTDEPEVARKKIMSATTDSLGSISYNKDTQPGIANLIDILALLTNRPPQDVAQDYLGETQYGSFKTDVADEVVNFLITFQERLEAVDDAVLQAKLTASETVMNEQANARLLKVQTAIGLR